MENQILLFHGKSSIRPDTLRRRPSPLHLNLLTRPPDAGSDSRSQGLLAVPAHGGEVDARVEKGEQEAGDEDEGAVEDEEADLVLHDFVAPAAGHFGDTCKICQPLLP